MKRKAKNVGAATDMTVRTAMEETRQASAHLCISCRKEPAQRYSEYCKACDLLRSKI
jgi:hypothetical protein